MMDIDHQNTELVVEEPAGGGVRETRNYKGSERLLLLGTQTLLRVMAAGTSLGATCAMLTSKQSAVVFGIPVDARYTYSSAFTFSAFVDGLASAFSLLSLFLLFILNRQTPALPAPAGYFILFLNDMIMMALVVAGSGAATAIGMVGKYGNSHTGWAPICDHLGSFCDRVTTSIVLSLLSALLLLILSLISSYTYSTIIISRHQYN